MASANLIAKRALISLRWLYDNAYTADRTTIRGYARSAVAEIEELHTALRPKLRRKKPQRRDVSQPPK